MQQEGWQASLLEQRLAWGVAAACMVLVVLAANRPQWFDFSAPAPEPEQTLVVASPGPSPAVVSRPVAPVRSAAPRAEAVRSEGADPEAVRVGSETVASEPLRPAPHRAASIHPDVLRSEPPRSDAAPARSAVRPAPAAPGYYVQLGAFQQRARARGLADQLRRHGWHALVVAKAGGLHAVWAGPHRSHAAAESQQVAIQRKLGKRGFIVRRK